MLDLFILNFYIFILATAVAVLEIQIEGKNGWAKKLPAWRPQRRSALRRLYASFSNDKELDGYHIALVIVLILTFFLPFAFNFPATAVNILENLSLFFLFMVVWDFLWFVWNPSFTIRKFSKKNIPWHKRWFFGLPIDYLEGVVLSLFIVIVPSIFLSQTWLISWFFLHLALFVFWTLISVCLSLVFLSRKK